jgi:hypothetical protein
MIRRASRVMEDSVHVGRKYWVILLIFGFIGAALFTVDAVASLPTQVHSITQSVGEALVVAVVVSLVVEPRLLRYFGEELSSQTFWASFYSQAPDAYRDAIKELAAKTNFAHAFNFVMSFDWAEEEKTVVRMTGEWSEHRENRGPRPQPVWIYAFMYGSCIQGLNAEFKSCAVVSQELALYANLMDSGVLEAIQGGDGRAILAQNADHQDPIFYAPPGGRYTTITSAVSYFGTTGSVPLVVEGPVLHFSIQLRGTALPDLYFSIVHPGETLKPILEGTGDDLAAKGHMRIGGVFIEGQSVVLSWHRKNAIE